MIPMRDIKSKSDVAGKPRPFKHQKSPTLPQAFPKFVGATALALRV